MTRGRRRRREERKEGEGRSCERLVLGLGSGPVEGHKLGEFSCIMCSVVDKWIDEHTFIYMNTCI